MDDQLPYEDIDIGVALREHRENLGLTLDQLDEYTAGTDRDYLQAIEAMRRPIVPMVESHHSAALAAWRKSEPRVRALMALREQWYTTPADWILWDRAAKTRRGIHWWWGARQDLGPMGAHCYVCGTFVVGFSIQNRMTRAARRTLMEHRLQHITALTAAVTEPTKEHAK